MAAEEFTATFALELDASDAQQGGKDAAEALAGMREQIAGGIDELRGMQAALRNMKGSAGVSSAAIADLKAKIAAQKATVGDVQARYVALGGSFRKLKPAVDQTAGALSQLVSQAAAARGPVGSFAKILGNASTLVKGGVIAAGVVGIAVALVALAAAAASAAGALISYGLRQADARRSELLQLEGLTKIRSYLYGLGGGYTHAADKAGFLQEQIDRVSGGVAIGRDKVAEYASQLYKMGLRAGNLQEALEGVAITSATQGEQQAGIFASWAAGAALTGQSVKALANDVRARLGGIAKAQLLSLDVQSRKLKENMSLIFSGLKIEGVLKGIASITELFSQATASGRAMKAIVDALGNTLGGMFDGPALLAKRFFQGMIIGALHLTIGVLQVRNWLRRTFGDFEILKGLNAQKVAVYAGVAAVGALAAGLLLAGPILLGLLVAAVPLAWSLAGALISAALVTAGPFLAVAAAIAAVGAAVYQTWQFFKEVDWSDLGSAIVQGMANGIKSGAKWVVDAISGLAKQAIGAFRDKFQIHSPSKLGFGFGLSLPQGQALGIRAGAPLVERAIEAGPQPEAASARQGPQISIQAPRAARAQAQQPQPLIGSLKIQVSGGNGQPDDIAAAVEAKINQILERVRLGMGAPSAAAP